ncbi:hypothetical protein E2320_018819, partial [Naja naja]
VNFLLGSLDASASTDYPLEQISFFPPLGSSWDPSVSASPDLLGQAEMPIL